MQRQDERRNGATGEHVCTGGRAGSRPVRPAHQQPGCQIYGRQERQQARGRPLAHPDPLLFPTLSDWAASSPLYNSGEISIGVLNDPVDAKKLGGAIEHTRAPYLLMRGRAKRAPESWRGRDGRAMAVRRQMGLRGIQDEGSEPTARGCGAARRTCTSYVRPGAQEGTD